MPSFSEASANNINCYNLQSGQEPQLKLRLLLSKVTLHLDLFFSAASGSSSKWVLQIPYLPPCRVTASSLETRALNWVKMQRTKLLKSNASQLNRMPFVPVPGRCLNRFSTNYTGITTKRTLVQVKSLLLKALILNICFLQFDTTRETSNCLYFGDTISKSFLAISLWSIQLVDPTVDFSH